MGINDRESREMRAPALECNLLVVLPDRDIMIVHADDQDPGPAAPPFTDFLRVVRDEGPADYTYLWMIDLLAELEGMRSSTDDLYQDVREAIAELRTELPSEGSRPPCASTPRSTKSAIASPCHCTARMSLAPCRQSRRTNH